MKTLIMFLIFFSTSFTFAQDDLASSLDCHECMSAEASAFELPEAFEQLGNVTAQERRDFIRRHATPAGGWSLALNIETNFKVPFVGSQNYFGRIYFKKGHAQIRYRDELLADDHYRDESANPRFYNTSGYSYSRMNNPRGYSVATGVRLIGRSLDSNNGGGLTIQVDPPGSAPMNIPMDVQVVNNRAVLSVLAGNRRVVFNQIKINATRGSILRGVENVQFFQNGRLVHTLTN